MDTEKSYLTDPPYDFSEEFQQKILSLAVRSDLLVRTPEVFKASFFGPLGDQRGLKTYRQHIAEVIEKFIKENPGDRLSVGTVDQLIGRLGKMLKPEERKGVEKEWGLIRNLEVPDPGYVASQIRQWARWVALSSAIIQSADRLDAVRNVGRMGDFREIEALIDSALHVGDIVPGIGEEYFTTLQDRILQWQRDPNERRLSTGFKSLDRVLEGGPQYGEVFYILAPPKGCKSMSLINLALNASRNRHGVAFFSYEMGLLPVQMRMDRNVARATRKELQTDTSLLEHRARAMQRIGAGPIWTFQFQATKHGCNEALRTVDRLRAKGEQIDLVVLDYLNIMSPEEREREKRDKLATISREMTSIARELDVVVWSAALVRREAVDKNEIRKTDIAEAFEVIAVLDGAVAICGDEDLRSEGKRNLFVTAMREAEDEVSAGIYSFDRAKMIIREVGQDGQKPSSSSTD